MSHAPIIKHIEHMPRLDNSTLEDTTSSQPTQLFNLSRASKTFSHYIMPKRKHPTFGVNKRNRSYRPNRSNQRQQSGQRQLSEHPPPVLSSSIISDHRQLIISDILPPEKNEKWSQLLLSDPTCKHTELPINKHNSMATLQSFPKKKIPKHIRTLIKSGKTIECDIHQIFKINNYFNTTKPFTPFGDNNKTTIQINFSNLMNTMLPTNYIGWSNGKMKQTTDANEASLFQNGNIVMKGDVYGFPYYKVNNKKQICIPKNLPPLHYFPSSIIIFGPWRTSS